MSNLGSFHIRILIYLHRQYNPKLLRRTSKIGVSQPYGWDPVRYQLSIMLLNNANNALDTECEYS